MDNRQNAFKNMFTHKGKLAKIVGDKNINTYKRIYFKLLEKREKGELPINENYLNSHELSQNIYKNKYYLKDIKGNYIEERPEDVFLRISAFIASQESSANNQIEWAEKFYKDLYNGSWLPGGRVLAGAGDIYRLKTLANCFVTEIKGDDIESIYKTASECARTYSYGGGIGVDISPLRPKDSIVHNAADSSTGAVSFMELFSMTTGLIGQSGRRGALMLTIDIKHPDIFNFLKIKSDPNWVSNQILEQCKWSKKFSEDQMKEIEKHVVENNQVRFANTSIKVSDEFLQSVEEEKKYPYNQILVYKKLNKTKLLKAYQSKKHLYSQGMPNKDIKEYEIFKTFDDFSNLNNWLVKEYSKSISHSDLSDTFKRDVYGDFLVDVGNDDWELAIKYSGDFLLYYGSKPTGEIRKIVKASEIWDLIIESNYKTAEPGLIFWTKMSKYSPSNYLDRPIISTNPCAEVPLEDGGACNLGSLNLSRFVIDGFTKDAEINWEELKRSTYNLVRFLDNVITWNESLNPLEKQKKSAKETRRLGIGIMGIADMLHQLDIDYDSNKGIKTIEKVMEFINNNAYLASSKLAKEKSPSDIFVYKKYSKGAFFQESLSDEVKSHIKKHGLRNIALTSIAPTGTISNIIKSFEYNNKNYIGVSGGIEPVFALYYTRRSESFNNKFFKVFHSTVKAYIDKNNLTGDLKANLGMAELRKMLPKSFFKTAYEISHEKRIQIQSTCQKFVDHSISSTINLPEDVEPEKISTIYLSAWKHGLKGVTIYRDGSRFPILTQEKEKSKFQEYKEKFFKMKVSKDEEVEFSGDEVMKLSDGTLTTPFHYFLKMGIKNSDDIEVV
ncbi:MAG: adenosylcobalamin-dependent ribonucleoside-diphosphate reductase [Candidatus Marinimicrobia bacterium]|nr:adenosylcobalamin-dependent ribonucleoside-diphosphate reductase [Candidatus Neomarinimicrobiota bacterium]